LIGHLCACQTSAVKSARDQHLAIGQQGGSELVARRIVSPRVPLSVVGSPSQRSKYLGSRPRPERPLVKASRYVVLPFVQIPGPCPPTALRVVNFCAGQSWLAVWPPVTQPGHLAIMLPCKFAPGVQRGGIGQVVGGDRKSPKSPPGGKVRHRQPAFFRLPRRSGALRNWLIDPTSERTRRNRLRRHRLNTSAHKAIANEFRK
jgi:hypothetical protein